MPRSVRRPGSISDAPRGLACCPACGTGPCSTGLCVGLGHERAMFDWLKSGGSLEPRKGMPSPQLDEGEFKRRFRAQFRDPAYDALSAELDRIAGVAWDAYAHARKAPHTRKAGPGFAD